MIEDTWYRKPVPERRGLIYMAECVKTGKVYIGQTRMTLQQRIKSHYYTVNAGRMGKFQNALRKYPPEFWIWYVLQDNIPVSKLNDSEKFYMRDVGMKSTYNIIFGGAYAARRGTAEETREKMRRARVGKKPALGMRHTTENRAYFKKVSLAYWAENRKYSRDVLTLPFREAKLKYNISKTHYYRLRKANAIYKSRRPRSP